MTSADFLLPVVDERINELLVLAIGFHKRAIVNLLGVSVVFHDNLRFESVNLIQIVEADFIVALLKFIASGVQVDGVVGESNPVKDLTVDFPVSGTDKGHVKASDAKRLLKYLYSTKQLRTGTQYFIKDVNGVETNWDFERCVYNTGYQYEFSCEVFDDDRDVYQALYISKDYRGKLDWADTEWVREKVK